MDYTDFLKKINETYQNTTRGLSQESPQEQPVVTPPTTKQVYVPNKKFLGIFPRKGGTYKTEEVPAKINLEPIFDTYYHSLGYKLEPQNTNQTIQQPLPSEPSPTNINDEHFDLRTTPAWKLELALTKQKNEERKSPELSFVSGKNKQGLTNDEMLAQVYDIKTLLGDKKFSENYPLTSQYLNKDLEKRAIEYKKEHTKNWVDYGSHENVPHEEWIRKGLTFGWGSGLPIQEPKTKSEKILTMVGQTIPMVIGDYVANGLGIWKALDNAALKVPGISQVVSKVIPIIQAHPYTWGLLASSGKGAVRGKIIGSIYGALQKPLNRKQWLQNINRTGNTFAFFNAIAYPLIQLLTPSIQTIAEGKTYRSDMLPGENIKEVTAPKSIYFRIPNNPDYYLKVTPRFVGTVDAYTVNIDPHSLPVLREGDIATFESSLPQFSGLNIDIIKKNKSLAQKLLELVRGKKVEFKVPIESTPWAETPSNLAIYKAQPSASPEPPEKPIIPVPPTTPTPPTPPETQPTPKPTLKPTPETTPKPTSKITPVKPTFTPKEIAFAKKSIKIASSPVVKDIRPTGYYNEKILTKLGHPEWTTQTISKQDYIDALNKVLTNPEKPSTIETSAFQFYSPNIEENTTFEDAKKMITSERQAWFRSITDDIDKTLGIKGTTQNAFGDWGDGAESTVVNEITSPIDWETLRYSAALKGMIGNQKAVIPFLVKNGGKSALYVLSFPTDDLEKIRKILSDNGIQFRTINKPIKGQTKVEIFDPNKSLKKTIKNLIEKYDIKEAKKYTGQGEFLGGETRAEGLKEYKGVIRRYESGRVVGRKRYDWKRWYNRIHNRGSSTIKEEKVVQPKPTKSETPPKQSKPTEIDKIEYLHSGLGAEPYSPKEILRIEKQLSQRDAEKPLDELPTPEEEKAIEKTRHYKAGTKLKMAVHMLAKQKGIRPSEYRKIVKFLTGKESLSAKQGATIDDARKVMTFIRELSPLRKGGRVYIPVGDTRISLDLMQQIKNGKAPGIIGNLFVPEFHEMYNIGAGFIYEEMANAGMRNLLWIRGQKEPLDIILDGASKEGIEKNIMMALNGKDVPLTEGDKKAVDAIRKWEAYDLRLKNAVRQRIGMPLIKPVKSGYLYRMYVSTVREAMKEKFPIEAGVLTGMDKWLPNQVWTPTFLHRTLTFDEALKKGLETNIRTILSRQIYADGRFLFFTEPIRKAKKFLPYYDYATQKHIRKWIGESFLNRPTDWTKQANQSIRNALSQKQLQHLDNALRYLGKGSEVRGLFSIPLRLMYDSLFFLNFAMAHRNLLQGLLDLGLVPPNDIGWGYSNIFSKQGRMILAHSLLFKTRMAWAWFGTENPGHINKIGKALTNIEQIGNWYFRAVDKYPNVGGMLLSSFHYYTRLGYRPDDAMYLAERNTKIAQFSYLKWDMPGVFRSDIGKPLAALKSWGLWYLSYTADGFRRVLTGKDMAGNRLNKYQRFSYLYYLLGMGLVWYAKRKFLDKYKISLWRSIFPISPIGSVWLPNPMLQSLIGVGMVVGGLTNKYRPAVEEGKKLIFKFQSPMIKRIMAFYQAETKGQTKVEKLTPGEALLRIFFYTAQQERTTEIYNRIGKLGNAYLKARKEIMKDPHNKERVLKIKKEYNDYAEKQLSILSQLSNHPITRGLRKQYTIDYRDIRRWRKGENEDRTSIEKILKIK